MASEVLKLQIAMILVIFVIALTGFSLPLVLTSFNSEFLSSDFFRVIKSFATGIIIGVAFDHLISEGISLLTPYSNFPIGLSLVMGGVLLTLAIEHLTIQLMLYIDGKQLASLEFSQPEPRCNHTHLPGDEESGTSTVSHHHSNNVHSHSHTHAHLFMHSSCPHPPSKPEPHHTAHSHPKPSTSHPPSPQDHHHEHPPKPPSLSPPSSPPSTTESSNSSSTSSSSECNHDPTHSHSHEHTHSYSFLPPSFVNSNLNTHTPPSNNENQQEPSSESHRREEKKEKETELVPLPPTSRKINFDLEASNSNLSQSFDHDHHHQQEQQQQEQRDSKVVENEEGGVEGGVEEDPESSMRAKKALTKSLLLEFSVAIHSVIIGYDAGLLGPGDETAIKILFFAFAFHQFFEGVSLGTSITESGLPLPSPSSAFAALSSPFRSFSFLSLAVPVLCLFFSLTLPLGMLVGLGTRQHQSQSAQTEAESTTPLYSSPEFAQGVANCVAGGSLVYTCLIEMVGEDFSDPILISRPWTKLAMYVALVLGCVCMAVLAIWS